MNPKEIIRRLTAGTETRTEELTVIWQDDTHALIKYASSKYWADHMRGYVTAPTHVDLVDLEAKGSWSFRGRELVEGKRLSKARTETLIRVAKLATARKRLLEIGTGPKVAAALRALDACREEIE